MYRLPLAIILLIPCFATAQDSPVVRFEDTSHFKTTLEESQRYLDSVRIAQETSRGIDFFVRYQKEQKAKQRRQAMIYLALGIFFLIVLIVGWRRRIKKK
jgi:hypothetical protein